MNASCSVWKQGAIEVTKLTVNNGTLNAIGTGAGIDVLSEMTVRGGSVTALAKNDEEHYVGIRASNRESGKTIKITIDDGMVDAEGYCGIGTIESHETENEPVALVFTVNGGYVRATGANSNSDRAAVYGGCEGSTLTINGGTLETSGQCRPIAFWCNDDTVEAEAVVMLAPHMVLR